MSQAKGSNSEEDMKAADIMTRNVVTTRPEANISEAIALLTEHDLSALPVVNESGEVVGIVSEADLMCRLRNEGDKRHPWWMEAVTPAATLAGEFAKMHGQKVHEVMTTEAISASEEASLGSLAALLEKKRIKRVPILRDGKLIGVVSRTNLLQALAIEGNTGAPGQASDRAIRLDLLARLGQQHWTDFGSRNIIVRDGVVHIWGLVGSPQEQEALLALAEEVPGVTRVADETIPAYE
jgi:CBS domain-containing protein